MREREIEKYLVQQVKATGGAVRKVRWLDRRGAPDRLVMLPPLAHLPGQTVWVELKAPGVKPEDHQLREHKRLRKMGQRVLVIDSLEDVDEFLGAF